MFLRRFWWWKRKIFLVVFGRIDFGGLGEERGVDRQR
jgi:hypothetical protein